MLFNSYIFIFAFLPICMLGFIWLTKHHHPHHALHWLLVASLFFYGWWNPNYLLLLLCSISVNYSLGYFLWLRAQSGRPTAILLYAGVTFNILLIAYFKYAYFLITNINIFINRPIALDPILLPLGISFYTFQKIAFLVDVSRGKVVHHRFRDYCLFITFFPQLIAGPIVQHKHIIPQFYDHSRLKITLKNISIGLTLFFIGLFKKTALADNIAVYANAVFEAAAANVLLTFWEAWGGALAYTLQLYFDFSGYSDMAIGLGYLFGITLPLNFFSPYKAKNIIDFWRRWHITLSHFLRDYLYISLGGNRQGERRRLMNLMITMLLGGLWHGANWTFVLWGALHGCYLTINHLWQSLLKKHSLDFFKHCTFSWIARLMTLLAVIVAWVPFRAESVASAQHMLAQMFSWNAIAIPQIFKHITLFADHPSGMFHNGLADWRWGASWIAGLLFIVLVFPNTAQLMRKHITLSDRPEILDSTLNFSWEPSKTWSFFLAILIFIAILSMSKKSEFLYFQF